MTISLPEPLKQFVEQQVSAGGYASAEEYIGALLEAERERARIEELILEGLESPATEMTAEDWEDIRRKVRGPFRNCRLLVEGRPSSRRTIPRSGRN